MKRNGFLVIFVAITISMLIIQAALAENEDPVDPVVKWLMEELAPENKTTAEQLRATLQSLSPQMLEKIAETDSVEEVNTMLAGTSETGNKGILALGDFDRDYVYTPVTPCRIVDTRIAGGVFTPGEAREYYIYGNLEFQGGTNCSSPKGEPRGVHINVTAVPQSGTGHFSVFPADVDPPYTSFTNYKAGVQNVANAGSVKTFFDVGLPEIEVLNRFGTAHLVIDVMGYYHDEASGNSTTAGINFKNGDSCSNIPTSVSNCDSITVSAPASGWVLVACKAYAVTFGGTTSVVLGVSTADNTLGESTRAGVLDGTDTRRRAFPMHTSAVFPVSSAGSYTFYCNAQKPSAFSERQVDLGDVYMNAIYFSTKY